MGRLGDDNMKQRPDLRSRPVLSEVPLPRPLHDEKSSQYFVHNFKFHFPSTLGQRYMIHSDVPESSQFHPEPFEQWTRNWTMDYNAEPFWSTLRATNLPQSCIAAGFEPSGDCETKVPSAAVAETCKRHTDMEPNGT